MAASVKPLAVVQVTGQDRPEPRRPGRIARHDQVLVVDGGDLKLYERREILAVHVEPAARVPQSPAPPAVAQPHPDGVRALDDEVGRVEGRVPQPVPVAGPARGQLFGSDPDTVDLDLGQTMGAHVDACATHRPVKTELVSHATRSTQRLRRLGPSRADQLGNPVTTLEQPDLGSYRIAPLPPGRTVEHLDPNRYLVTRRQCLAWPVDEHLLRTRVLVPVVVVV